VVKENIMAIFNPGEVVTANVKTSVSPSGLECHAILALVKADDPVVIVNIAFVSTGITQEIQIPVDMPMADGRYIVWLDISVGGEIVGQYIGDEYVDIKSIASVVVDFPDLVITDVEGIPFSSIGMESGLSYIQYIQALTYFGASGEGYQNWPEYAIIAEPEKLADFTWSAFRSIAIAGVGQHWQSSIFNQQLVDVFEEAMQVHPDYFCQYALNYPSQLNPLATYCLAQVSADEILTAHLSEPVNMSKIRGIKLTAVGKDTLARYASAGIESENYLWYEPTFIVDMPPPAFAGGGKILVGDTTQISATGAFSKGYYYPGIYDGRVSVRWYSNSVGREYAVYCDFKIKNLVKVTGEGVI
jgi:hypothetical protein